MNIAMNEYFTPLTGVAGGSMIGLAAVVVLIFNGNVLGASGILSHLFDAPHKAFQDTSQFWKLVLLSTFLLTSTFILGPKYATDDRIAHGDASVPIPSELGYAVAGLLVGFGSKLGNGCTSGHGVCGLGRRSKRSLMAVMTFMTTGILTAILNSPDSFLAQYTQALRTDRLSPLDAGLGSKFTTAIVFLTLVAYRFSRKSFSPEDQSKLVAGALAGVLFSSGLAIGGMVVGSKLHGFLNMSLIANGTWDPTLATVLGSAVPISMLAYHFVKGFGFFDHNQCLSKPLMASKFSIPNNSVIDKELIVGAAMFGMGWGLGLVCPAPAIYHAAVGNTDVLFRWIPGMILGSYLAKQVKQ